MQTNKLRPKTPQAIQLGNLVQGIVQQAEFKMRARQRRRYQVPATEDDRRLTQRMCGEREDD